MFWQDKVFRLEKTLNRFLRDSQAGLNSSSMLHWVIKSRLRISILLTTSQCICFYMCWLILEWNKSENIADPNRQQRQLNNNPIAPPQCMLVGHQTCLLLCTHVCIIAILIHTWVGMMLSLLWCSFWHFSQSGVLNPCQCQLSLTRFKSDANCLSNRAFTFQFIESYSNHISEQPSPTARE